MYIMHVWKLIHTLFGPVCIYIVLVNLHSFEINFLSSTCRFDRPSYWKAQIVLTGKFLPGIIPLDTLYEF